MDWVMQLQCGQACLHQIVCFAFTSFQGLSHNIARQNPRGEDEWARHRSEIPIVRLHAAIELSRWRF